jgi:hypothetical protein
MDHDQAAERTRSLLARSDDDQWEAARITHDMLATGQTTQRRWASAVGISKTQVLNLRNVWAKYGGGHRGDQRTSWSFNEYLTLARLSEDEARELEDRARNEDRSPTTIHRERRREPHRWIADKLDDEILDRMLQDDDLRDRFERALQRRNAHRKGRRREHTPEQLSFDFTENLGEVERDTYAMLARMLRERVAKAERRQRLELATRIRNGYDWMIAVLTSNDPGLIRALERALAKGAPLGPLPDPVDRATDEPEADPATRHRRPPPPDDTTTEAPPPPEQPGRSGRERRERTGPKRRDSEPVPVG